MDACILQTFERDLRRWGPNWSPKGGLGHFCPCPASGSTSPPSPVHPHFLRAGRLLLVDRVSMPKSAFLRHNLAWKTSHRRDAHTKMSSNHESHLHSFPLTRYLNYTCTVHSMFPQDQSIAAVSSLVVCGFHVIPKTCSTSRTDSGSHNDIQVGRCSR